MMEGPLHCLLSPRFWAGVGVPAAGRFPDAPPSMSASSQTACNGRERVGEGSLEGASVGFQILGIRLGSAKAKFYADFRLRGTGALSLKCNSTGRGGGRGDKIWALLGPGAGKADGGSCYWGPRWGTRPAPPVPSLGLEGNALLLSRSPGCVWRDWADGSGGGAREGAARGGRPGRRVGGSTCPDPSARRAGGARRLDLPAGAWPAGRSWFRILTTAPESGTWFPSEGKTWSHGDQGMPGSRWPVEA